jgi:Ras-related protein Rab-20
VSQETGQELAKQLNENKHRPLESLTQLPFFETSSKTGENVDKVFEYILENCLPLNDHATAQKYIRKSTGIQLEPGTTNSCDSNTSGGKCCH